jgi:hypothetical protein
MSKALCWMAMGVRGKSQRAGLPQVMMMISIVLFQKQTELGSIYLEEGTDLGDTRQETQHRKSECVVYL